MLGIQLSQARFCLIALPVLIVVARILRQAKTFWMFGGKAVCHILVCARLAHTCIDLQICTWRVRTSIADGSKVLCLQVLELMDALLIKQCLAAVLQLMSRGIKCQSRLAT